MLPPGLADGVGAERGREATGQDPWGSLPARCSPDAGARVLRPRRAGEDGAERAEDRSLADRVHAPSPLPAPGPAALASPPRSLPLH